MTIISSETRATHHRRASSASGIIKVKPERATTRTVSNLPLGIVPLKQESTTLVQDFILSFKELEGYK